MSNIAQQLLQVKKRIADAANLAGRAEAEIQLLAVSKTKPLAAIQAAYQAGQRRFGESYVQEAVTKVQTLREAGFTDLEWHFIGPVQSNKTRPIAEHFDWVDSVDRLKIAERLNAQRPEELAPLNICIQVNISGESQKSGTTEAEVLHLAEQIAHFPRLKLRGLMAIAENTPDVARAIITNDPELMASALSAQPQYETLTQAALGLSANARLDFHEALYLVQRY